MKNVISTLAADNRYTGYIKQGGLNQVERAVLVRGGSGVALRSGGESFSTPSGVRTEVSDEDADWLMNNEHFKEHLKRGFVRIEKKAVDPEKAARTMADDDGGKPKTPEDVKKAAKVSDPDVSPVQAVTNKGK